VTAADRASHGAIVESLERFAPGEPVRSEEGGTRTGADGAGRLWIADPLDGTREFIARIAEFSVLVGLTVGGEASLGAVYLPAADRLFVGVVGRGAWSVAPDGGAVPVRAAATAPRTLRLLFSRSHPDPGLERLAARLGERQPTGIVRSGSAGTKCVRVASGEADLYVHPVPHLREWDTCAGEAVARGAGARVTDCRGRPLRYGKADPAQPGGIFVAPPAVWQAVAADVAAVAPPAVAADAAS
jgi:3'(2'), 5'-bisphosphate nucleotidase